MNWCQKSRQRWCLEDEQIQSSLGPLEMELLKRRWESRMIEMPTHTKVRRTMAAVVICTPNKSSVLPTGTRIKSTELFCEYGIWMNWVMLSIRFASLSCAADMWAGGTEDDSRLESGNFMEWVHRWGKRKQTSWTCKESLWSLKW